MEFSIEIDEVRGCSLPSVLSVLASHTSFKLHPPIDIPDGCGYVEFCRATYTVQPLQQKQRIRLRRRGSVGRKKRVEIFTRDLTGEFVSKNSQKIKLLPAEEGRDYFNPSHEMGVVEFGEAEIYKTFEGNFCRCF